ncbi:MAG TPA: acetate kinase [Alphaproteobacteria bacterium]|nr:acetate kinase [Alphaproteobacteria bacterium]
MKKILVINSGSSSLKYQLFNVEGENYEVVAKGIAERIGIEGSNITLKIGDNKQTKTVPMPTHDEAFKEVINFLLSGPLKSVDEISAVGHRVLHGGELFQDSVKIDEEAMQKMESLKPLGPLHMPANISGIRAVQKLLPNVPQVAVFDTVFHQTMKKEAFMYALPLEYYTEHKIRRYGFHGISHAYVSKEAAKLIGKKGKIITCHLGNGASLAAVNNGKCVDTSMGFTPLAGIIMGTRSGDIDPFIAVHLQKLLGKSADEVNNILNKQSGMFGICGFSDNRDVETRYEQGDEKCVLAMNMYVHSILRFIGSYIAVLGGVDAIVFTAGVGENGSILRAMIMEKLAYLGIKLNAENNKKRGQTVEISTPDSKVHVYVIPTNEELMIAEDTMRLAF